MNLKTLVKLSLSVMFVIAMLSGVSFAQLSTVYVDVTNGSNTYTGANATNLPAGSGPKATLKEGLKAVANGGKIVLLAGTYNGVDELGGDIDINSTTYTNITSALTIELRQLNSNNEVKFTAGNFIFNVAGGTLTINSTTSGTEFINLAAGNVTLTAGNVSIANAANFKLQTSAVINIVGGAAFTNAAPTKGTNVTLSYTGGTSITAGPESNYGDYGTGTITVAKTAGTSITFPNAITKVAGITVTTGNATFNGAVTTTGDVTLTTGTNQFAAALNMGNAVGNDARLAINGGTANFAAVTFSSTANTLNDAITVTGTATATFSGNVDVKAGDIVVSSSNNVTFNGNVAFGYRNAAAVEGDVAQISNSNTGTVAFNGSTTWSGLAKLTVATKDFSAIGASLVVNSAAGSILFSNVSLTVPNTNAAASSSPDGNFGVVADMVNSSTGTLTLGTVSAPFATASTSTFTSATVTTLSVNNSNAGICNLAGDLRGSVVNGSTGAVNFTATTTVGGALTNTAAASGTITANGNLTVAGIVTNAATKVIALGSNNLTLTGAVAHATAGGKITATTGLVNINATSTFDGGAEFPAVVVATGKVATFNGAVTTMASLTLNGDVTANANMTVAGTTNVVTGNLIVANTVTLKTLNFTQFGGTATLNGNAILWVQGDFNRTSGTFTANGTSVLQMKGTVAQNLNGGPLLQLVNLTFDNTTAPITLGQSVRAYSTVTIAANTALTLNTLNIILNANSAAIVNNGSYTAIGGGGVIFGGVNTVTGGAAVTGTTIAGSGAYSYITVDVGAANTVTTASAKVKWNGVLTLKSGNLTVAAGQDFAPTGTAASIIRDVTPVTGSLLGIVAGGGNGTFNVDVPTDYDLTYIGALTGVKTITAGTSELDLTHVRNLTVSTTGTALQLLSTGGADVVVKGNVTLSEAAEFDLDAGTAFNFEVKGTFTSSKKSILSGSTALKAFKLTSSGITHSIVGTVSALSPLTVSGTGVTINGSATSSAAASGFEAALQDVAVANNGGLTLANIQKINGTVTTGASSSFSLGMAAPDAGDGVVAGAVTLGGSVATLTSDITANGGVTHNKGSFDFGAFKLTMTGGAYTRAADVSAVYPSTTGTLVLNNAGMTLTMNGGSIPKVEVKANTVLSAAAAPAGDVTISTLFTHTAGQVTLNAKLIVTGNMTYTAGTYTGATPVEFDGDATKITAAASFTIPNVTVNSAGIVTLASSSTTTPRALTVTGLLTQTAGTIALGFNDIILTDDGAGNDADYTRVAGSWTATSTGTNIGELVFNGANGNHILTPGATLVIPNVKISAVTGIAGTNAMTVANNFYLGANFNMVADSRLAISDGATITRNAGIFDKNPAFGGNALNVIYTGAIGNTLKELPAIVNNLTVNAAVTLNAAVTVNGTLTCGAAFTVTNVAGAKYPTLGAGASLQMNAGGSISNPVVPTGALNLIYNGVAASTNNDWPATANIGSLTIKAATALHANRTVAGSVTIANDAAANDFDLNGKTLTVQGDVTVSGDGDNFFISSPAAPTTSALVFAGATDTKLTLNSVKKPQALLQIKLAKTSGTNTVTLVGNSLDFHANMSTLYFGNGLIVTGDNYVKLYAPLFGLGQGFDRTAVTGSNTSHIVGNVRKQLQSNGTIAGSTDPRSEFPVGSSTMYRLVAITFNVANGAATVPNTTLIVNHVDAIASGKVGLPIVDGIAAGTNLSRYPSFFWNITSIPSGISPSTVFDLELGASGFSLFDNVTNIRTIRRLGTNADVTNPWVLQGGTSQLTYDNSVIGGVPTVVVRNATSGIIAGGAMFTLGLKSNMTFASIANQTLQVGGSKVKIGLTGKVTGASGAVTYAATTTNATVATVAVTGDSVEVTPVAQGSTEINVTATDATGDFVSSKFSVAVNPVTNFAVSGKVTYDNTTATAVKDVVITLTPGNFTATTGADGTYTIANVPNGSYSVKATTANAWGGANSTDALRIANYYNGKQSLTTLQIAAADVNASATVNNTDALKILRRFNNLDSTFTGGDWTFTSPAVTVNGATVANVDVKALNMGDVNGSNFATVSMAKTALSSEGTINVNPGATLAVPVMVDAQNLGAVSLKFKYSDDMATLAGVSSKLEGLQYSAANGVVTVAWADLSGKSAFNADSKEAFITLNFKPAETMKAGKTFGVELVSGELATADGKVINNALLKTSDVKVAVPSEFALRQNYPNPFNPTTTIQYDLPVDSKVSLVVFNMLGQEVASLVNGVQSAGTQKVQFSAQNLTSGIYFYTLNVSNGDQKFTQTYKMILMK